MGSAPGRRALSAIAPRDLDKSETLGYAEALCGVQLPDAGLEPLTVPTALVCLPCVIGATADLPDPGRMGTTL